MNRNRKLIAGILVLLLLCGLTGGATYALVAGNYTADGGSVSAGTIAAGLYWSADRNIWYDAEEHSVFGGGFWEPGYTQVRYLRVENAGSLEFSYQLSVSGRMNALADVIDVYVGREIPESRDLTGLEYLGSLSSLGEKPLFEGKLLPGSSTRTDYERGSAIFTLVLKMRESAGNSYHGLTLSDLTLTLNATQFAADGSVTMETDLHLVEGVTEALPRESLASAKGVNFSGASRAYTNTSLVSGNLHPNYAGMDKITDCFLEVLYDFYVEKEDSQ